MSVSPYALTSALYSLLLGLPSEFRSWQKINLRRPELNRVRFIAWLLNRNHLAGSSYVQPNLLVAQKISIELLF